MMTDTELRRRLQQIRAMSEAGEISGREASQLTAGAHVAYRLGAQGRKTAGDGVREEVAPLGQAGS